MNAPHLLQHPAGNVQVVPGKQPRPITPTYQRSLAEFGAILFDDRLLIVACTCIALLIGACYAFLSAPAYRANVLIQVEDSSGGAKSLLGEAASLFDAKTPATAEMEIIRSRMVIGRTVDRLNLYIDASPRYWPVIGNFVARQSTGLSEPGIFGWGGWTSGRESIEVVSFEPPRALEGTEFTVVAGDKGTYQLRHPSLETPLQGKIGTPLVSTWHGEPLSLLIQALNGKKGAEFKLVRHSTLRVVEQLQRALKLTEKGRQSGVIEATLQDRDVVRLTRVLTEIGNQYVRQNIERRAAEAQKTLDFLHVQLPQLKEQLEASEDAFNRYRNHKGTVAPEEEAKLVLTRTADTQTKLVEAQQRRRELLSRFTPEHPAVKTLDEQIAAWQREFAFATDHLKKMPSVQQESVRLERDVKLNTQLYQQLQNSALQLQLVREGKIGNVRLIDSAVAPEEPVGPNRALALFISPIAGLFLGAALTLIRASFSRGAVRGPMEIEVQTSLNVLGTIPISRVPTSSLRRMAETRQRSVGVLAWTAPDDPAVESFRSLRTALQFRLLGANNNIFLITGGTPGVGKSFVSSNLAAVFADAGRRVLIIDADLRKGRLNETFGVLRDPGLSDVLTGTLPAATAIAKISDNLDFIPTGVFPKNPAELLLSPDFPATINSLAHQYDLVIIDSAPVLAVADTLSIASLAATILLVARAGHTHTADLRESSKRVLQAGSCVAGAIFNGLDLSRRYTGQYGSQGGGAYTYTNQRYGVEAYR